MRMHIMHIRRLVEDRPIEAAMSFDQDRLDGANAERQHRQP
jgi:hypothetical protein